MMKAIRLAGFGLVFLGALTAHAGELSRVETRETDDRYSAGHFEIENLVGTFFMFDRRGNTRLTADYVIDSARAGIMLSSPRGSGLLRGNLEFLGEVFGGGTFYGPDGVLTGVTLFLRYNFVQPGAKIVPYLQIGGGGVYTDLPEGSSFDYFVGQSFNFNLQAIGGVRFNLTPKWSILAEGSYRHISNAGISDPNYGLDHLGGALGLGYSF